MADHQGRNSTLRTHSASVNRDARRRARLSAAIAFAASLTLVLLVAALAAPADLDPTFDADGRVTTDFGGSTDLGLAMALQPDGKIVVAGNARIASSTDFALARYNADGSLDTTFDTDGKVTTTFGTGSETANALALQPDGKIVAAGSANIGSNLEFAIARYNADGSLDATFDTDGKVTTNFGTGVNQARAVAVQPDGKIVAAGTVLGSTNDFAVARYNADGSLDAAFDTDGKVTTDFGNTDDPANAVALQPDGKIIAAGRANSGGAGDFALARYNTDGSLDTTFDTDGKVRTDLGTSDDLVQALALQPDGKIVAAGIARNNQVGDFAIARYNADGSLDVTFDTDGKATTDFTGDNDLGFAVAIQPDGKIVAAGRAHIGPNNDDFALARYNADGSLDATFDIDGKVTTPIGTNNDEAAAVAIQPDGKIVAAGRAIIGSDLDFALAHYAGDPRPNETSNFDTDRQTDVALWNPSNHNWYIIDSTTQSLRVIPNWGDGALGDRAVPGDYDGDGKTDIAVFRPSEANWYIVQSSDNTALIKYWGNATDIPVPGDYDGDGRTDLAVWRPAEANWYIIKSRDNAGIIRHWGLPGDKPVPADYDGDGQTDIAVFRPSDCNWYIVTSRDRFIRIVNWGLSTDRLVPADYDGDGRTDVAVFRDGVWFIRPWASPATLKGWGNVTDITVPADYDGDGRADIAVYRPTESNWYIIESSTDTMRLSHIPQAGVPVAASFPAQQPTSQPIRDTEKIQRLKSSARQPVAVARVRGRRLKR